MATEGWIMLVASGIGLIVGSFLTVCIHRLPRGESVVTPRSRCPACGRTIAWYDNVPLLGYLWLRGRCRWCREPISWEYPVVEGLNALGYLLLVARFGWGLETLIWAGFYSALLVVSWIDLRHQIIPDRITLPGMLLGLGASTWILPTGWKDALIGLILGAGFLYLVALASRGGMGGGDVKLLGMIGAFLGWKAVIITILMASFTGSLVGITLMLLGRKARRDPIPFGPFLSLGALVALFFQDVLVQWYLGY